MNNATISLVWPIIGVIVVFAFTICTIRMRRRQKITDILYESWLTFGCPRCGNQAYTPNEEYRTCLNCGKRFRVAGLDFKKGD